MPRAIVDISNYWLLALLFFSLVLLFFVRKFSLVQKLLIFVVLFTAFFFALSTSSAELNDFYTKMKDDQVEINEGYLTSIKKYKKGVNNLEQIIIGDKIYMFSPYSSGPGYNVICADGGVLCDSSFFRITSINYKSLNRILKIERRIWSHCK